MSDVYCDGVSHGVVFFFFFLFNDTATTEIYTLSLHDALPICLIFVAAVAACLYLIRRLVQKFQGRDGTSDFARAGGVASLVEVKSGNKVILTSNLGVILDGATMVLVEISFILLWTGLVMGAIWADHSWGRPWGWDPKEVFALNTFLIFAVLIHVRGKVKDKGMWTAMLALAGCGVMLFNWIIINFTISGLHSYA